MCFSTRARVNTQLQRRDLGITQDGRFAHKHDTEGDCAWNKTPRPEHLRMHEGRERTLHLNRALKDEAGTPVDGLEVAARKRPASE